MRIAILDDDKELVKILKEKIEMIAPSYIKPLLIDVFTYPVTFLEAYSREKYDILFLDLQLEGMNGIDVGMETLKSDKQLLIIILSAFDYRYESYNISPIQYLDKPIDDIKFKETFMRAVALCQKRYYLFKTYNEQIPLEIRSIIMIETHYDEMLVLTSKKTYIGSKRTNYNNFKSLYLPTFCKLDRSRIINLDHIVYIDGLTLKMSNDDIVEIPRMKRKLFKDNYINYLENGKILS